MHSSSLRTASLFSGIGGMCLGTPVLYCEIDARARAVLEARMADGSIPTAPIVEDITTLESLPEVDMIEAGFPCQGVSSCGQQKGLADDRSGLFWHVARLTAAARPPWVMLENVEAIRTQPEVWMPVLQVMSELGYDSHWVMLGANQVGAPHRRNRWFCLCKRVREPGKPAINTLPTCANIAACGSVTNGAYREEAPLQLPTVELNPPLVMRPFPGVACRGTIVQKDIVRKAFATPRCRGGTFAGANLTFRGANDLGSQLKFALDTPEDQRKGTQTFATWVEWLMGLPCGYTLHAPLTNHIHNGWSNEPEGVPRLVRSNKMNTNRLHLLGNACVPAQSKKAFEILQQRYTADATRARIDFKFLSPELRRHASK